MTSPIDYRTCPRCGVTRIGRPDAGVCGDCPKNERPDTMTPRERGVLAHISLQRAQALACMVRDEGRDSIGVFLDRLDRQALYGLTVVLAAMVDIDRPADELIAWTFERVVA